MHNQFIKAAIFFYYKLFSTILVKNCIHLWQFLRDLLQNEKYNPSYICWIDKSKGIFKVVEPNKVSQLWAIKKGRKTMSYENLSRGLRYEYNNKWW